MFPQATILIAARNAKKTIRRAVLSAVGQGDYPIILIDDFSTDETVSIAQAAAPDKLSVISPPKRKSLGLVRHTGLMAVETPFGIWLDADDELLPGRVNQMVHHLTTSGAEIASDGVELFDGPGGFFKEVLPIPEFLKDRHPLARLFERNYLPGPGVIGFRADFARSIGYDCELHGPEDTDFLLRAIVAGARIQLLDTIGYRLYAYPESISRQLENQRAMYRKLLQKHEYDDVKKLYLKAGYSENIAFWGLASMALYRDEFARALDFINVIGSGTDDFDAILEREGPCPRPEGWRLNFSKGTLLLLIQRPVEALLCFEAAGRHIQTAEGANNRGIALFMTGREDDARRSFEESLALFPTYLDASINFHSSIPGRITLHPLRVMPSRRDYSRPSVLPS